MINKDNPDATDACNCLWSHCKHHQGTACSGVALGFKCEHAGHDIHWLGDAIFGDGIHICPECSDALHFFFVEEIGAFMKKVSERIPHEARTLENIIRRYYAAMQQTQWTTVLEDCHGVLMFVNMLRHTFKESVSDELLVEGIRITKKLNSIRSDMQPKDPLMKIERSATREV